jgi:hypothetical protein
MKIFRVLAAALLAGLALCAPAKAANVYMCSADVAGGVQGPRTIGGTLSQVPSGAIYVLNGQGCALIAQADVGWFASQGYTQQSSQQSILYTTGVQTGTTDIVIGSLPANAYIVGIFAANTTANAVTGGISIGSTANGTDIVATITCAANCVSNSPGTNTLVKSVFSTTAATSLHAAAVTAWNSANVTFTVVYAYF